MVDDSSFGGITREYQVRVDPDKLISYGLSLAQVEQQLTNTMRMRAGALSSKGAAGECAAVGLITNVKDIEKTVLNTQNGAALRVKDIAAVTQGPKIRLGQIGKAIHRTDGVVREITTSLKALCSCVKARRQSPRWTVSKPR